MKENNVINIRKYKDEDYKAVTIVHVNSWKTTYKGIVPQQYLDNLTYKSRYEMNRNFMSNSDVSAFVAEDSSGKIIGFATCGMSKEKIDNYDGELYGIYILEEAQGKGLGKRLVHTVREELIERGFKSMIIWALEENKACEFYKAMGGKKLEEEQWLKYGSKKVKAVSFGFEIA